MKRGRVKMPMLGLFERSQWGGGNCGYLIFVQISWYLHQMTTSYRETKLKRLIWKLVILHQFCTKNGPNLGNFMPFLCWYKYLKMAIFYKRSHQNDKIQIFTFCEKPQFPLVEIFQIRPSWIFWPRPPLLSS